MSRFLLSCMFRQHPILHTFCKISLGLCPGLPGPLAQVGRCVWFILEQMYSFSLGKGDCVAVRMEVCPAPSQVRGPAVLP